MRFYWAAFVMVSEPACCVLTPPWRYKQNSPLVN
jgi:hypothetical protein